MNRMFSTAVLVAHQYLLRHRFTVLHCALAMDSDARKWPVWEKATFQTMRPAKFSKRLPGMNYLLYNERLRQLDLPSLEFRRLHLTVLLKSCFWSGVS